MKTKKVNSLKKEDVKVKTLSKKQMTNVTGGRRAADEKPAEVDPEGGH